MVDCARCTSPEGDSSTGAVWNHLAFSRDGLRLMGVSAVPKPQMTIWRRTSATVPFEMCCSEAIEVQYTSLQCSFFPGNHDSCVCIGTAPPLHNRSA